MKSSFFTGLDKRQSYDISVVQAVVPDPLTLGQAALLALGLSLILIPGSGSATALPQPINADVVRGFAIDTGVAKTQAPAAAAKAAPATGLVSGPAAQPAAPPVAQPAAPAPAAAKASADTGGARAAMDPQVILGLAQPAVQQAPAATARVEPKPVVPTAPAPKAATPTPMAQPGMPARPPVQPSAPAPLQTASLPQPAATAPGRSSIDANAIRGFANSQWSATGQPASAPKQPVPEQAKLKPLSQADLDQLRSIFAPEM